MSRKKRKFIWGLKERPEFPFLLTVGSMFQGWRDTTIMSNVCFLKCSRCGEVFFILKRECQKELVCPRGCGVVAEYVWDEEGFLVGLFKSLLSSNGDQEPS